MVGHPFLEFTAKINPFGDKSDLKRFDAVFFRDKLITAFILSIAKRGSD
jgi:hypothetical protein